MKEQIDQARKAGYSESEITNYLVQKHPEYANKFKQAKEAGYSDNDVLMFFQKKQPEAQKQSAEQPQTTRQEAEESALQQTNRTLAQIPQGLAEFTPPGLISSGLQFFGIGEALTGYNELEERLPELKKKFPQLDWPEKIDKEKYMEAVRDASESFPTVANIGRMIEEQTGIPLTPKSGLDKAIRFIANIAKGGAGNIPEKIVRGVKGEVMKEALEHVGVPEEAADIFGLYYGLHQKTPEGFKLPPAEKTPNIPPSGEGVPPPGGGIEPPSGSSTPPPTGPGGISAGAELPQTKGTFQRKEQAIEALKPAQSSGEFIPETSPELTPSERFFRAEPQPIEARPLTGRVRRQGRDIGLRPAPPPTGRPNAYPIEDEIGDIFSRQEFFNTRQGGQAVVNQIRHQSEALYQQINEAYDISRQLNRFVDDTHPQLVNELEEFAAPIREIARRARSGPQRAALNAVDDLLGQLATTEEGAITRYTPINNQVLIDTMQSLRQKIDHDFMHGDASNIFRRPINAISEAVERAAQGSPEALEALQHARQLRRQWGETFDNAYVRPLRDPANHDYSKIFRGLLDLDEFIYLRPILNNTPRGRELEGGIARDLVKKRITPLIESDGMINPRRLDRELRELQSFITPEQSEQIQNIVRQRQQPRITRRVEKLEKPLPKESKAEKPPTPEYKIPEDIDKSFKTRSGIRKLHKDLKKAGKEDLFKEIAKDKATEIFKEGQFGAKKLTGEDIAKTINKNHEVLAEILGEEELNVLFREAQAQAKKELSGEWIVEISKKLAKKSLKSGIIKTILTVLI